ncbi:MAG TPA: sucrose-6-phosphate hydrolase [Candidatus Dormibacteraeota bacterium]|nr:sucrose-6-phosphate hydrolase [Candidatus Dormibacteraeota bacterium]
MIVALDLDRTLIHATRDVPAGGRPDRPVEELAGAVVSVMTAAAVELYAALCERATVVPATTRSVEQLRRVRLPVPARWAVAANGGVVLAGGTPDAAWTAERRHAVDAGALAHAERLLRDASESTGGAIARVTPRDGLYLSAVLTGAVPAEVLSDVHARLRGAGWQLVGTGRKLYALPPGLDKAVAVSWIARRCDEPVGVAAGDSVLDAGMLRLAALAICPRGAEVLQSLDGLPVWVTPRTGPEAGEDVLARTLEAIAASPDDRAPRRGPVPILAGQPRPQGGSSR